MLKIIYIINIILILLISIYLILNYIKHYQLKEPFTIQKVRDISQAQNKMGIISSKLGENTIPSPTIIRETVPGQTVYIEGPMGPMGQPAKDGKDGDKLPLFKFISYKDDTKTTFDILTTYPQDNYPSDEFILQNNLTELIIPVPRGKSGRDGIDGQPGIAGVNGEDGTVSQCIISPDINKNLNIPHLKFVTTNSDGETEILGKYPKGDKYRPTSSNEVIIQIPSCKPCKDGKDGKDGVTPNIKCPIIKQ